MSASDAALVIQHSETAPPVVLAEWALARRIPIDVHLADPERPLPDPSGRPFVVSLGSKYSPVARDVPQVSEALRFTERALADEVPVLGLCYGGQLLADVLGGEIERAPEPELGWYPVRSTDPAVVSEGPWLQWHFDCFTTPPGAELLAESDVCAEAFAHGRSIGVQFHPESTIEIVSNWARKDRERLLSIGVDDGEERLERGREHADNAVMAAFQLFDAFYGRATR